MNRGSEAKAYALLAVMFFVSGFCGLVYQMIWLRLAFAHFGVITPVISLVVSVFMMGLGIGSWCGGKYITRLRDAWGISAIGIYAMAEFIIGVGAVAVPAAFVTGQNILLKSGSSDSLQYLALSAVFIVLSVLPFAVAMGTTFPFVMSFMQELGLANKRTFGFLYVANVAGAVLGTILTVFCLVELFGFRHTLWIAAGGNFFIAIIGGIWAARQGKKPISHTQEEPSAVDSTAEVNRKLAYSILFITGLTSLAMEVVWTRAFAPILGNVVYSFAGLLAVYLYSTCGGSLVYRFDLKKGSLHLKGNLVLCAAVTALIPIFLNDPRVDAAIAALLHAQSYQLRALFSWISLFSIAPFCGVLGYLTPALIDDLSNGDSDLAGRAYAVNVIGGIIGPLSAGYTLLPLLGVKLSLVALILPLLACVFLTQKSAPRRALLVAIMAVCLFTSWQCFSWEENAPFYGRGFVIRRDYVATTISCGSGMKKSLMVNGYPMTGLGPCTKLMAHLPLAFHHGPVESALTICFGMGTTFRALASWGVDVTVVELVPSVPKAFSYYWSDADTILQDPRTHVVIDDGRRFLERSGKKFDVITIDPPPPVNAVGSSLLYSNEFYALIKQHLNPGGLLQQWYPSLYDNVNGLPAVARSLGESFPYVRAYKSIGDAGIHFLCSMQPIDELTARQIYERMPESARKDMAEEADSKRNTKYTAADDKLVQEIVTAVVSKPIALNSHIFAGDKNARITDDQPYNEYSMMRGCNGY